MSQPRSSAGVGLVFSQSFPEPPKASPIAHHQNSSAAQSILAHLFWSSFLDPLARRRAFAGKPGIYQAISRRFVPFPTVSLSISLSPTSCTRCLVRHTADGRSADDVSRSSRKHHLCLFFFAAPGGPMSPGVESEGMLRTTTRQPISMLPPANGSAA